MPNAVTLSHAGRSRDLLASDTHQSRRHRRRFPPHVDLPHGHRRHVADDQPPACALWTACAWPAMPNAPARSITWVSCSRFVELHGDRAFGDDQALIGGLGRVSQPQRAGARAPGRHQHPREHCPQLRDAEAGRISQGASPDAACRKVRPADRHLHRHLGRRSRDRLGRARPGHGDRREPAGDGGRPGADRVRW